VATSKVVQLLTLSCKRREDLPNLLKEIKNARKKKGLEKKPKS
jgi:hypothetical protein